MAVNPPFNQVIIRLEQFQSTSRQENEIKGKLIFLLVTLKNFFYENVFLIDFSVLDDLPPSYEEVVGVHYI